MSVSGKFVREREVKFMIQDREREKQDAVGPAFASLTQISEWTGLSYRTVHRAAKAGKFRTVHFGGSVKVPRAETEKILRKGW